MATTSMSWAFMLACAIAVLAVRAADPDPLQDFCVADLSPNGPRVNGVPCKARNEVSVKDFYYTGFRKPAFDVKLSPTGAIAAVASVVELPGLNTQGVTHARLDFDIGGVVPLHTHPRAAETLYVVKGRVYTGFISDDNVLYAATLQPGDVILFPKALLHFQLNVGNEPAVTFNTLTSQNPGLLFSANQVGVLLADSHNAYVHADLDDSIDVQIFEPNITSAVIEKSFGIDAATVQKLKASIPRFT